MKTLYLRNVPDDVAERLARLASRMGMSVAAFAVRELSEVARRADNPELLAALPDHRLLADQIVSDLDSGRSAR